MRETIIKTHFMDGSHVIIKNNFTKVESQVALADWEKMKSRREIYQAFSEVETINEPPEVTALKNEVKEKPAAVKKARAPRKKRTAQ